MTKGHIKLSVGLGLRNSMRTEMSKAPRAVWCGVCMGVAFPLENGLQIE